MSQPEQGRPQDRYLPVPLGALARAAGRFLLVAAAVAVVVWLAARLYLATMPTVLALILAAVFIPPAQWLERRGLPPALAAFAVLFGALLFVVAIFAFIIPSFVGQLDQLQEQLEQATEDIGQLLGEGVLAQVNLQLSELRDQSFTWAQENVNQIVGGAVFVVELLAGAALTVVLLFFFVKDRDELVAWFDRHVPDRHRADVRAAARRGWQTLGGYFRGVLVVALVDAVAIGAGLFFIGVPLLLPIMVLVFIGAFFPVVGAFVAGLVAVLLAFVSGGVVDAALTFALIVVVQQVEGNVLQPVVMRRAVPLHPAVILFALTAGGVLAGVTGAFLAVPFTAVAVAAGGEVYRRNLA